MAGVTRKPGAFDAFTFDVFISYSRRDAAFARKLQRALDNYTPPGDLPLPQRRLRTFRDESDFKGNEYGRAVEATLASSATLLVICSPDSRASAYVGGEIASFAAVRGPQHIVSVIVAGHPNNEIGRGEAGMAFHDELASRLAVPLAADYRGVDVKRDRLDRDRFESAWYKLLADIYAVYAVERSEIEGREKRRQQRTRRIRAAVVSVSFAVLAALTLWALVSRNEAIVQGNTARSRFLAVQSMSGTQAFDVAMLLAVAAYRATPTFEAWEALFVGLQRQPHLQRFLNRVDGTVDQLVVARGGTCAAAWIDRRHTIVWDLPSGSRRVDVTGRAVPDGGCRVLVVASPEGGMEARPLQADAEPLWSAASAGGPVTAWATDPTGTLLAAGHAGGHLLVRDLTDGRVVVERAEAGSTWRYLRFSSDGHTLAAVDQEAMVHQWDAATLGERPPARDCGARSPEVFAISPDLRWCAAGGPGEFAISDLSGGGSESIDLGPEWILALDFSADSQTLMAGVQGGALQFRAMADVVRDGERARAVTWSEHRTDVTAAVYAPDGRSIVSAARDGAAIVWSPKASSRLLSETDVAVASWSAIAATANAPAIAVGTPAGDILVSRTRAGGPFVPLTNLGEEVTALAWRSDGEVLAGTAAGRLVGVTPDARVRVFSPAPGVRIERVRLNDGQSRAAVALADGRVSVWDVTSGRLEATVGEPRAVRGRAGGLQPAVDAAFEPGGSRIVSVHGGPEAFVWTTREAPPRLSALPFTPTSYVTSVAFSGAGHTIALGTGMYEEEIILLDPSRSDAPVARLPSHNPGKIAVTALAFSPDGRVLVSGLFDGSITAWDVAGRRRIGDVQGVRGEVTDVSYAHNGSAVAAVTDRGVVLHWNLDPVDWVTMACAIANRDVSTEERARFLGGASLASVCP